VKGNEGAKSPFELFRDQWYSWFMSRPLRIEFPAWYHVMNRGCCRERVYKCDADMVKRRLYRCSRPLLSPLGKNRKELMKGFLIFVLLALALTMADPNRAYANDSIVITIALNRQSYNAGDSITAVCAIRNLSKSTIWLPPLPIEDLYFTLYNDHNQILPFARPEISTYGLQQMGFIKFRPGQERIYRRILEEGAYKMPVDAGEYRICVNYKNTKESMRNILLWVGKLSSCALLKIR
jgi:hypothetical protein